MKKLSVLLGIILLSMGASFAYMNDGETSDIDLLRTQGYSEAILQVVDTAKYHDSNSRSKRYYKGGADQGKKLGKGYSVLKIYVDPLQDDGRFGEHQINFSNSWDWGRNRYSERYKKVNEIENL